jgi:hypothetical protein
LFFVGVLLAAACCWSAEQSVKGPQAYLPENVFEFKPVVEGSAVAHGFALQNRGDAPLKILKIASGWGCTAASSVDEIPPGQEGRIEVKVATGGYGGQKIKEDVRIYTNDSQQPGLFLTMTGFVEKFVEIRPERVRLFGSPGRPVTVQVEIIPRKEYPFKIRGIGAKDGQFIRYELVKTCGPGQDRCIIRIENTKTDKGRYLDAVYVATDSRIRPLIPIYVTGLIQ